MSNKRFTFITIIALISVILTTNIITTVPAYSTSTSYVDKLFSGNRVINIDIVIDESDWEDLKQNPLNKTVYNVTAIIDGEKVSNVGMRTKGDSTLNQLASNDNTDRYSYKIDFDYYDSSTNFYGLTKLNLNCAYQDNSYMKNNLSYKLFKMMGVPYCEAGFAYITINGEEWGLYEMIEGVEESYLIKNFGVENSTGDLYKPDGTGSDLKWIDDNYSSYTGMDLKTNKDTTDNSKLIAFLNAINNTEGADLEKYLNVDEALRYFAVNTALANMDSYQGSMKHNYYLYEIDGVFQILPWDYNLAFGGMGGSNISIDNPTNGNLEDRPLLNILLSNEEYKERYYDYLEQVANIFTDGTLKSMIEEVTNLIEPYVIKDTTKFCTMEQFYEATDTTGTYTSEASSDQLSNINGVQPPNISGNMQPPDMSGDMQPPDISGNMQPPNSEEEAENKNFRGMGRGGNMGNTGNLLETAKKLSESILKQLSGETVVTTSSMNRGAKEFMQNMNFENRDNNEEKRREDFEFNGGRPSKPNDKGFNHEPTVKSQTTNYTQSTIIILISTVAVIITLFILCKFKKRKFKLQQ